MVRDKTLNPSIDLKGLLNSIRTDVSEADRVAYDLIANLPDDDYYKEATNSRQLRILIDRIYIKICLALEALGLNLLLADFKMGFERYRENLTSVDFVEYVPVIESPTLEYMSKYVSAISSVIDPGSEVFDTDRKKQQLKAILSNTNKIISDLEIEPRREKDICDAVYRVLIHVFPDTVREVPIPKESKSYKLDFGVRSLKTGIEFKFADSEKEVRKCIGEIYTDTKGYAGSDDWQYFYAVIYMTSKFLTLEQIKSEFAVAGVDDNWEPIVVVGKGQRDKI